MHNRSMRMSIVLCLVINELHKWLYVYLEWQGVTDTIVFQEQISNNSLLGYWSL